MKMHSCGFFNGYFSVQSLSLKHVSHVPVCEALKHFFFSLAPFPKQLVSIGGKCA